MTLSLGHPTQATVLEHESVAWGLPGILVKEATQEEEVLM